MAYKLMQAMPPQFEDVNGNPLSGGSIEFYINGTSTPSPVYFDVAGAAYATSVELNSLGMPANSGTAVSLYQDDDVVLKAIIKDSSGSTVRTITDIAASVSVSSIANSVVNSIAALRLVDKTVNSDVFANGYYAAGDGGGGHYWLDSSDTTSADNGGTIIVAADGGRWKLIYSGDVTLKQFGAKGDGTTNDQPSIQAAINSGVGLYATAGTYKVNSALLCSAETFLIHGDSDSTIFDFSSGGALNIISSVTSLPDMSANLSAGENAISFTSAHGLSRGDVIALYNPTDYSFAPFRDYYRDGCMFRVADVPTASSIVTYGVSRSTYLSASIDLYKVNGGKVSLRSFKIIPPTTGLSVWIDAHQSVRVVDVEVVDGSDYSAIEFYRCFDVEFRSSKSEAVISDAYPVVIANCQKVTISSQALYSSRHSVAIGGRSGSASVPSRDIFVDGMIIENDGTLGVGAADIHGGCENVTYQNCHINSSANMGGKNSSYINCVIIGRPPSAYADGNCVFGSEVVGGVFRIEGCKFITYGDNQSFGCVYLGVDRITSDFRLVAKNNIIENRGSGSANARLFMLYVGDSSPPAYDISVEIDGLSYIAPSGFAVLSIIGANDVSGNSSYIIDNISGPSGLSLMVFSNSANSAAPMRMQRQCGSQSITATSGTSSTNGAVDNFRYPYPRLPAVFAGAGLDTNISYNNNRAIYPGIRQVTTTTIYPWIESGDATNWTSTVATRVHWSAEISEI